MPPQPKVMETRMGPAMVLVIEDDPTDFTLLERAFRKAEIPVQIHWSENGLEAINFLEQLKESSQPFPVLILSDLKMPLLDGFDVLKIIKADPLLRSIPIVVLTNSAQDSDVSKSYEFGANSYLVKPSAFDTLVEVSHALRNYRIKVNR